MKESKIENNKIGRYQKWDKEELKLLTRFFENSWSILTLFEKIHKLNPLRTYESISRQVRHWKSKGWEKERERAFQKLRVGYFDIETTNLNANFGYMLSWYIKKAGKNEYEFSVITKQEIFDYKFDRRLITELLDAFENYDIIYTHWGAWKRFDVPFFVTRAYAHGLEKRLCVLKNKIIKDTWPISRVRLKLHSNRLDSIAEAVGVKGIKKTPMHPKWWRLAGVGHPDALKYVSTHNKRDVQLLERVHQKLEIVEKKTYSVG